MVYCLQYDKVQMEGSGEMSQFREKLRRRVEVQTARDHTRMRRWSRNREARILRTVDAPFLLICIRVCALCMAAGTLLCVSGDLAGWLRAGSDEARLRFLRNAALSALVVWGCLPPSSFPAPSRSCARGSIIRGSRSTGSRARANCVCRQSANCTFALRFRQLGSSSFCSRFY